MSVAWILSIVCSEERCPKFCAKGVNPTLCKSVSFIADCFVSHILKHKETAVSISCKLTQELKLEVLLYFSISPLLGVLSVCCGLMK